MAGSDELQFAAKFRHQGRAENEGPDEREVRAEAILSGSFDRESEHGGAEIVAVVLEQHSESSELGNVHDAVRATRAEIEQRGADECKQLPDGFRRRLQ